MNWLLLFVPVAVALHYLLPQSHTIVFAAACLAIIPLAAWLGRATDQLANRAGDAAGAFLNATFGNATELIIGLMALRRGLGGIVKASLTGSILGNLLLVMGAAVLAGGIRYKVQQFNPRGARVRSTMLTLAAIAFIAPAAYHWLAGPAEAQHAQALSTAIAVLMLGTYALELLFSMRTHKQFFVTQAPPEREHGDAGAWTLRRSLAVLGGSTVLIAWISEILVGSVEVAAKTLGMTDTFVGLVIVAIIGNAAEHSAAVHMALRNRMEVTLGIAVGSSTQIALFVAPALVLASYVIGPRPMDLVFTPAEVGAVVLAVAITGQIASDGESNWMEGVQLLAVYLILAAVFYFLPAAQAM